MRRLIPVLFIIMGCSSSEIPVETAPTEAVPDSTELFLGLKIAGNWDVIPDFGPLCKPIFRIGTQYGPHMIEGMMPSPDGQGIWYEFTHSWDSIPLFIFMYHPHSGKLGPIWNPSLHRVYNPENPEIPESLLTK